ncbi:MULTISPECIES: hypothetical protein [Bifidobacterium]|jgi:hypothetical protein|uniref:Uncharacterized protein n=1 Tax=Bifidobacterium tibiigranuli TaxID=2172043 RepID=A0A5N6RYV6_9BIFI|nr:hypothetical protein [Bifidobacterium tibiigranuli]KAE8127151.1 hypothetical protein DDE84_08980 [Bifidobacterium tibiigranuli]KAE8127626.1 hypothetical protein DDF78_08105 [Bifidobacterium tibiigranuli]MCH3974225.1 hypothetical protein [Bifidobacterium tibiigranuli]MCH4188788.1 hypothetical protein [Bifidobacterium tibiigranuli]MCH4203307.1 hypothetical protein [Bifidobacterium tibiigranuli]
MSEKPAEKQYKYGRTKPGGIPAIRMAIPIGLPVAIAIGTAIRMISGPAQGPVNDWLVGIAIGLCLAPSAILLAWALCVDRTTIPGATPNTENSIESTWYSQSANDAFHAIIMGSGLGTAITALWLPPLVSWTLIAVFVVAAATFAVSYLIRKHQGNQ